MVEVLVAIHDGANDISILMVVETPCPHKQSNYVRGVSDLYQEQSTFFARHFLRWLFRGSREPPLSSVSSFEPIAEERVMDYPVSTQCLCQYVWGLKEVGFLLFSMKHKRDLNRSLLCLLQEANAAARLLK